jgi:glycosyltransferase involved in cell wall biosynthesis
MTMLIAPVSVVVPCYRCVATLERAVLSVVGQTQRPAEMILVDDASGDGTLELLWAFHARFGDWIRIVTLPVNAGAASARNAGWNVATQPYIAFLDADDAWHPRKIEVQCDYMQRHPDVVLSGHLHRQLPQAETEAPMGPVELVGEQEITWVMLLLRNPFVTPSVMIKREIALRFGEGLRHVDDHRLWLEILGAPMRVVKLQADLVAVYKPLYGASGLSADMWGMEKAELANYRYLQNIKKISKFQAIMLQLYSLLKYMRRIFILLLLRGW